MRFWQLTFTTTASHVDAYSDELLAMNALSITLEDPDDQPLFEPEPDTTPLWEKVRIVALFDKPIPDEHLTKLLGSDYTQEPIADNDWVRASLDQFTPMSFGNNLWICPTFKPIPDPNATTVLLDPGVAFGTGSHETTRLCLEWLAHYAHRHSFMVDYGCGSGILGIAALKLGVAEVSFIDHDPQALESTQQNLKQNNLTARVFLSPPDFDPKTTLIVANILAKPLIELAPWFSQLSPGSTLVLSGLLTSQIDDVVNAYHETFILNRTQTLHEWACLELIKQ